MTRDPDDDYVIHLARAHSAEVIVSGDADLLEWVEQDPPVIRPAEFETRLSRSGDVDTWAAAGPRDDRC